MPSIIRHYPTAPLAPRIDADLPFRSWTLTADAALLAQYNAALPVGEPAAPDTAAALAAAAEWLPGVTTTDSASAAVQAIMLLLHPDERVPIALLERAALDAPPRQHMALFHYAIRHRLGRPALPALPRGAGYTAARAEHTTDGFQCTPLLAVYLARHRPLFMGYTPQVDPATESHVAARLAALHAILADQDPTPRESLAFSERYLLDLQRAVGGPLPDDVLLSSIPLVALLTMPRLRGAFRPASRQAMDALTAYGRHTLIPLMESVVARAPEHGGRPLPDDAWQALRTGLITWVTDELRVARAGRPPESVPGPAFLLSHYCRRGEGLTADELRGILGDLTRDEVDPRPDPRPGVFQPDVPDPHPHPHVVSALARLAGAITDGYEDDLELVLLGARQTVSLAPLISRITMTPRLARVVLRVSAEPGVRAALARRDEVRHDPVVDQRLLATRSAHVMATYLESVAPERFAHAFCRYARQHPNLAVRIGTERWADIHDFMDLRDIEGVPAAALDDQAAVLRQQLLDDLVRREAGEVPPPIIQPPRWRPGIGGR